MEFDCSFACLDVWLRTGIKYRISCDKSKNNNATDQLGAVIKKLGAGFREMSSVLSNQTGFNRSSLAFTAGIASVVGFVGYALYFDHKRRSDPNYKQKIRQNRKMKQKSRVTGTASSIPDPRNQQAMQQYFFEEMTLGEELMNSGNLEEGVIHMSNAVFACDHPAELLQIFQQTLPQLQFEALAQALPEAKIRHTTALRSHQIADAAIEHANSEGPNSQQAIILDEDLE